MAGFVPEEIQIGLIEGANQQLFNDSVPLLKHPTPHKIKKITVQYDSEHVWGIKI